MTNKQNKSPISYLFLRITKSFVYFEYNNNYCQLTIINGALKWALITRLLRSLYYGPYSWWLPILYIINVNTL